MRRPNGHFWSQTNAQEGCKNVFVYPAKLLKCHKNLKTLQLKPIRSSSYRATVLYSLHTPRAVVEHTTRTISLDISVLKDCITDIGVVTHARGVLGA